MNTSSYSILLVEDEPLASAQLAGMIAKIMPSARILAVCDTIASTVHWLQNNEAPDLAFFDIQLGDGYSFEIFEQCSFASPVIFTTAYNEFALQAFKVNSVDYLLKPIQKTELQQAIEKFQQVHVSGHSSALSPTALAQITASISAKSYKERFIVKIGTYLRRIDTKDVLYFYSHEKATYIKCTQGKNYLIDHSLEQIEHLVDPKLFFRINRKYLVALPAIEDVLIYSSTRLKLHLQKPEEEEVFVAREKMKSFKLWLEGELV